MSTSLNNPKQYFGYLPVQHARCLSSHDNTDLTCDLVSLLQNEVRLSEIDVVIQGSGILGKVRSVHGGLTPCIRLDTTGCDIATFDSLAEHFSEEFPQYSESPWLVGEHLKLMAKEIRVIIDTQESVVSYVEIIA